MAPGSRPPSVPPGENGRFCPKVRNLAGAPCPGVAFCPKVIDNAGMSQGKLTKVLLFAAVALGVASGCDKPPPSKGTSPDPSTPPPKVGAREGAGCRASDDCDKGLACANDKTCQTLKTIDCRSREDVCVEDGRCLGKDNKCVPASDADCKKSKRCETDGRCTAKDDKCVAATDADCKVLCDKVGRCTLADGSCIAASAADCKNSEACVRAKRCRAVAGRCIGK
jgi:hypothetical protein